MPTRLHIIPWHATDIRPAVRWIIIISSLFSLASKGGSKIRYTRTRERTDAVSHHRTDVSNCSALLSRDHTAALAHASSRTERRSFDELTRTVNHGGSGGGEGLASSATGTAERARTRPSARGPARAGAAPVLSSGARSGSRLPTHRPRYVAFVPPRGLSRDHDEKSRNALYTVWHEGCARYLFALVSDP